LPATLPVFVAVVLPCLGWHSLISQMPDLLVASPAVRATLTVLPMVGAVLMLLRSAVQNQLTRVLGTITAALLAVVWWQIGTAGTVAAAGVYVMSVTVAAAGLLLGAQLLDARYGVLDIEKLSGLARPMPRLAVVVGLLFMAAIGLPILGVFTGFLTMMAPGSAHMWRTFGALIIWFVASMLLLKLWHRLFYGRARDDHRYRDLTSADMLPFVVLLALLVMAAGIPADRAPSPQLPLAMHSSASATAEARR
jgi:NADH-quinone oxidoreductase subunit M